MIFTTYHLVQLLTFNHVFPPAAPIMAADVGSESCLGSLDDPLLPDAKELSAGIDMTALDLYDQVDDGDRSRVFEWNCTDTTTHTSHAVNYTVPDWIDTIEDLSGNLQLDPEVFIIRTAEELRGLLTTDISLNLNDSLKTGYFSGSFPLRSAQDMFEQHQGGDVFIVLVRAQAAVHRVSLQSAANLTKYATEFLDAVNRLPADLDDDSAYKYEAVFKRFGTHYISSAMMGGSLSGWYTLKTDLLKEMDLESIKQSANASFLTFLEQHAAYGGDTGSIDFKFTSNLVAHSELITGGKLDLFTAFGYGPWLQSVNHSPALLPNSQLGQLTDLLPDTHSKKPQLEAALDVYATKTYLDEVLRSTRSALKNPESFNHRFLRELEIRIIDATVPPLPSLNQAKRFKEQLTRYTVMPDWFKNETQVCVRFGPYSEVCSQVGVPTQRFGGWNPPLDHSPCEGDFNNPNCASGRMYFKAPTEEAQRALLGFGGRFEVVRQSSYVCVDYHQIYAARFVIDTSSESTMAPAWLRSLRVCVNYNKIETGVEGVTCAAGPNEWVTGEVRVLKDPAWWSSPVSRADTISFYTIY